MNNNTDETTRPANIGLHGHKPALQVICLGSSGGPSEENVTGLLVRSIASDWAKGSLLAVDAGSHLAPITKILEHHFPRVSGVDEIEKVEDNHAAPPTANHRVSTGSLARMSSVSSSPEPSDAKPEPTILTEGPFEGLKLPNASARANALHILHNYISTYLITHPHLDHLSGFVINTAAFHATNRPKTVAALPSTVDAIKHHVFNDIIWPNLTDEDGGVGFVTFQRLKEGGDVMVGDGEGRGYIEVSDGLGVKSFKVSHGVCTKSPPSHHHRGSLPNIHEPNQPPYHGSHVGEPAPGMSRSGSGQYSTPGTPVPGLTSRSSFFNGNLPSPRLGAADHHQRSCVVDSTAFFVRDTETHREVLIFGDVEPDSISLSPRTYLVWQEAARKIAHGLLGGIFIESSYDDSQVDAILFGHLNPKHLIAELKVLAGMVVEATAARYLEKGAKKRKRSGPNGLDVVAKHAVADHGSDRKRSRSLAGRSSLAKERRRSSVPDNVMADVPQPQQQSSPTVDTTSHVRNDRSDSMRRSNASNEPISPKSVRLASSGAVGHPAPHSGVGLGVSGAGVNNADSGLGGVHEMPLSGIKVVVIHIKDTMKDGPHVRDNILAQLRAYEQRLQSEGQGLGCEFFVSREGESYWF